MILSTKVCIHYFRNLNYFFVKQETLPTPSLFLIWSIIKLVYHLNANGLVILLKCTKFLLRIEKKTHFKTYFLHVKVIFINISQYRVISRHFHNVNKLNFDTRAFGYSIYSGNNYLHRSFSVCGLCL